MLTAGRGERRATASTYSMAAGRTPALPSSAFAGAVAGALADATTVTSGSPSTIAPSIAAAATTATATTAATLGQRGSDR